MHELPVSSAAEAMHKSWFYSLHKTLGVTVLFLAVLRIGWTILQPHPKPLNGDRWMENLAAQTVHWILYGAIIAMPLSGWLHHSALEGFAPIWWPLPQDLPLIPKDAELASVFGAAHFFIAILLGVSLVLHIGGALKHLVLDRDETLARMIPFHDVEIPANLPDPQHRRLPPLFAVLAFAIVGTAILASSYMSGSGGQRAMDVADAADVTASRWQVDMQKSRLDIQIIQSGSPVTGKFEQWRAIVDFDPNDLAAAQVSVEVDVASLNIGAVSEQARSTDFLNATQFPVAKFVADKFVETGTGIYEASGSLDLAGHSRPIVLPFVLVIENGRAFVEGRVTLNRLDFDIGRQGFSTDQMIGFGVDVIVTIEAEKPPAT